MGLLTYTNLTSSFLPKHNVSCFEDKFAELTNSIYEFFSKHQAVNDGFIIANGILMDALVVVILFRFAFYGTSWRIMIALLLFYILRLLFQVHLDYLIRVGIAQNPEPWRLIVGVSRLSFSSGALFQE